ncbi:NAD-dependent deacetylase sirtuin-2 [Dacryopinax primogenitus]|uniref:NAD-dependent deacetylase sirtuin-2 n=1 Tax=Dacryopinax primogenitus (strain DJM 731) TaxID=1858805 RepID=M5FZZ2_DACPD|nr:NAD-dependent deacetylase sirtuin-2 [Dacryopinax primogenitus]EJT99126.1 NAD-dependent deacetylase sirtuin-2 [Dacryopinax primogenitus]
MGNEESQPTTRQGPNVLSSKDIRGVAEYMKSEQCRKVYIMAGAGISTSAGIPDFRSPETGLYHNLQRLNLPYAEAVFDIDYFRENPIPFYTLAKDMDPSKFRPTLTHSFFKLMDEKGLLNMCFTQNIDTLERRAGLAGEKIIEAHGSFASNSCIECKMPFDEEEMSEAVEKGEPARCDSCGGLVKPDIVFFGEGLPSSFFSTVPELRSADLLFILGTSLTVMPFAGICRLVPESCPRVLINLDAVGDIGSRPDDVLALGECDTVVRKLCEELGWLDELERLWAQTEYLGEKVEEEEVGEITRDIERKLKVSEAVEQVEQEKPEKEEATAVSKPVEDGAVKAEEAKATTTEKPEMPEKESKDTVEKADETEDVTLQTQVLTDPSKAELARKETAPPAPEAKKEEEISEKSADDVTASEKVEVEAEKKSVL